MSSALSWLADRVPMVERDAGVYFRWHDEDGHPVETLVDYVADTFGAAIEHALSNGDDVVQIVIAADPEDQLGWHAVWQRWRQLGYV